jgi:hypothetical protein
MRFDINRLSVLAGLPAAKSQRLSEASNRSLHEDPALSDEADHRFGKNQLAEEQKYGGNEGDESKSHPGDEDYTTKKDDELKDTEDDGARGEKKGDKAYVNETVYEVDPHELKEELKRLRRMSRRKNAQRLQEAQLKTIIEQEVKNVFKDLEAGKLDLNISGDWVYGNNKPRNSRIGRIARGFKSIGFK